MVQGWKRHRHSCYTVTNQEQINEDARIGYYCHGHLLTVEDRCVTKDFVYFVDLSPKLFLCTNFSQCNLVWIGRFEQAFVNSLLSASGANSSLYYWIGLMSTGDDDEDGDGGLYIWDRNTDPPVPLTFTNWNKHQPGSHFLQVCNSEINIAEALGVGWGGGDVGNVLMNVNVYTSSFILPQSVVVAALLCQVGPNWVGGR